MRHGLLGGSLASTFVERFLPRNIPIPTYICCTKDVLIVYTVLRSRVVRDDKFSKVIIQKPSLRNHFISVCIQLNFLPYP